MNRSECAALALNRLEPGIMLIFNGQAYAKSDKEFTESLFRPINGRTCNGFYRKVSDGIKLFRPDWTLDAFIIDRQSEKFVVSAPTVNGKPRHMFACSICTEKWLGPNNMGMLATFDAAKNTEWAHPQGARKRNTTKETYFSEGVR